MTRLLTMCAGLCAMAFVLAANPAQATGTNLLSYVSNTGSNGNGCTNPTTDACASFRGALAKTASYGEIDCVNGYKYGDGLGSPIFIGQSVTIDCAGGVAQAEGPISFDIAGGTVRLRNLSFGGAGHGNGGINLAAGALYIENCVITNFNNAQINAGSLVGITVAPETNAQLFITNSIISNNGDSSNSSSAGIYISANGEAVTVSIDRSQITGNYAGIVGDGTTGGSTVKVTISDSVVSGNSTNGVEALGGDGSSVLFLIDETEVAGNANGLTASGSGAAILARNTSVFGNTTGLSSSGGGTLYSYGNNSLNGNATNGAFTGTVGTE